MAQNPGPQGGIRKLKRGEYLVKPGEKPKSVFIVSSGRVSVLYSKSGKNLELFQAPDSQPVCEELIYNPTQWLGTAALALRDSQVLELPVQALKEMAENLPAPSRALFKGVLERVKHTSGELKDVAIQKDQSPCPGEQTARVFGVILHAAKAVSKVENGIHVSNWAEFKDFAHGILRESLSRIDEALQILVKLGYAEVDRDSSGTPVELRFKDLLPVENFFEFFHTYYFKGGHEEMLKTHERASRITQEFLRIAEPYEADRMGMVTLPFKATIDALKSSLEGRFEHDQLLALQSRGLMIKHTPTADGGALSFYRQEFIQMQSHWRFLKEIELWNERGFVDLTPEQGRVQPTETPSVASATLAVQASASAAAAPTPFLDDLSQALSSTKMRIINPPSNAPRMFRKGEFLFKAGEPADRIFLLQSGLISLSAQVDGEDKELTTATAPQLVGEEALWGDPTWSVTAVALNDTETLELSVQQASAMIDALPGSLRLLMRSALKKQKQSVAELLTVRQDEGGARGCPHELVPKLFAILYHAAISTGRAKDGKLTVVWPAYRKYCHWGLLESPVRLEQAIQLLARLGYAELQMVQSETDPEAPEELGFVHFNPQRLEELKSFYRFYHEAGGTSLEQVIEVLRASPDSQNPLHPRYLALLEGLKDWALQGSVEALPKAA